LMLSAKPIMALDTRHLGSLSLILASLPVPTSYREFLECAAHSIVDTDSFRRPENTRRSTLPDDGGQPRDSREKLPETSESEVVRSS